MWKNDAAPALIRMGGYVEYLMTGQYTQNCKWEGW